MLSIGKLAAGGHSERYYTQSVAKGREDYYAGTGEAPGRWIGAGWGPEEHDHEVSEAELRTLLEGRHPQTDAPLRRVFARSAAGFDLTFSAPKSVSILFGIGDRETSLAARDAHDAAVREALGYLERNACQTRRGRAGVHTVAGEGFLGAAFRHRTSRAGDPQLHTHVVVANGVKGTDGRWGALDGRLLYRHAKTAGYLYQAALREGLAERLGVDWTPVVKGSAEVIGIPRGLIYHFSRRREEITLALARRGLRSGAAAHVAALDTRRRKEHGVPVDRLRADWRARGEEQGFGAQQLHEVLERTEGFDLAGLDLARAAAELAGARGVTREASTFNRRTVIQAWAQSHRRGASTQQIEDLADDWLSRSDVIELQAHEQARESIYSTEELLGIERELIASAERRQHAGIARGSRAAVDTAVAVRASIGAEQVDLVDRLVTSGDGVQVVRSAAGTGKTFALDAARDAWETSGVRVIGCALSARAAAELRDNAGITSTTIARLQLDIDRGYSLAANSVLIVDEAGMVGTRDLAKLAQHTELVGAKLVLVGDDRQLPEINAGGAFRGLADRLGALELREVRRQAEHWDRQALLELRDGDVSEWARQYRAQGRVVAGPNAETTRDALVNAWWQDVKADPAAETVMIALRRRDVADLNERAREHMRAAGSLGTQEVIAGRAAFSQGDHVVMASNDRILDVANGERGRVVAVDPQTRSVRVGFVDREVDLPPRYLDAESLQHAYAMTAHRLQGATVDRAHVLGSDELYREWGYTALSRHRDQAHFYITASEIQELLPGMDEYDAITGDVLAPLRREKGKNLASDLVEHDVGPATDEPLHPDVAVELLSTMPVAVRALRAAEHQRAHAAAELEAAQHRLRSAKAELDELSWRRGRDRLGLERRNAALQAAADHWAAQLELTTAARDRGTSDAVAWIAEHPEALNAVGDHEAPTRGTAHSPAAIIEAVTDRAEGRLQSAVIETGIGGADELQADLDFGP